MSSFSTLLTKPPSSFLYKLLLSQTPPPPILRSCNLNFLDLSEKLVYSVKFHLVRFDLCSSPVKTSMNLGSAIHCDHYLSLFCVACKHGEQSSQWQMPNGKNPVTSPQSQEPCDKPSPPKFTPSLSLHFTSIQLVFVSFSCFHVQSQARVLPGALTYFQTRRPCLHQLIP